MTTEPEPGPHGEPWEAHIAEDDGEGEPLQHNLYGLRTDGEHLFYIGTFYCAEYALLAADCVNACHKAGVVSPEGLAEFIAQYRILRDERACLCSFGPEECDECADWARVDRKLAALEGKESPDSSLCSNDERRM